MGEVKYKVTVRMENGDWFELVAGEEALRTIQESFGHQLVRGGAMSFGPPGSQKRPTVPARRIAIIEADRL